MGMNINVKFFKNFIKSYQDIYYYLEYLKIIIYYKIMRYFIYIKLYYPIINKNYIFNKNIIFFLNIYSSIINKSLLHNKNIAHFVEKNTFLPFKIFNKKESHFLLSISKRFIKHNNFISITI